MSSQASAIKNIERYLESERADIGNGIPLFARGRLNCGGQEDYIGSASNFYRDVSESALLTLSPLRGQWGINQHVGPAIPLQPVFNGTTFSSSHRNWEWFGVGTDVSTRRKGWGRRPGTSVLVYRGKSAIASEEVGAIGRIRFTGTGFVLYYTRDTFCSKFQIRVDGTLITTINSYNAAAAYATTYTAAAGTFTNAEHILEIVNVGDGVEIATNFTTQIEQLEILPTVGPTYVNGNPVVTNISDTSQLCAGWTVVAAGLAPGGATILTIDSATQITMSANAVAGGDGATTFAPPTSIVYDLFLDGNNLRPYRWSNSGAGTSARYAAGELAWYGGYLSLINVPGWRYVGNFMSSAAGYTKCDYGSMLVWNMYNSVVKRLIARDATANWNYTIAVVRAARNDTTDGSGRVSFIIGVDRDSVVARRTACMSNTNAGVLVYAPIGLNSTAAGTGIYPYLHLPLANGAIHTPADYEGNPPIGYNYLQSLEYSAATGTTTWYGNSFLSGLYAWIKC